MARDIALEQTVAIKTIKCGLSSDPPSSAVERFISEAQTWILLQDHPHIVHAKATFMVRQQPFLVMEYLAGGDLGSLLERSNGPLAPGRAVQLGSQFCCGAGYAHQKLGLVHRDIKPSNLLLDPDGNLKITDFGIALVEANLRERGTFVGTPLYMAPEQWGNAEAATKQSDIYSFGIVLYEMLTGRRPFAARDYEALRKAHEEEIPLAPNSVNPLVPQDLSAIVMKCMEKNPLRRFYHYEDLAEQLQTVYRNCPALDTDDPKVSLKGVNEPQASAPDLLNSGDSLFTIGKYAEALRYYDRLLEIEPQTGRFWQRKGQALANLGKHHEAVLYFSKALEIEPSNLGAVKGKLSCLMQIGKPGDALKLCNPILELNPNDKELLTLKRQLTRRQPGTEGKLDLHLTLNRDFNKVERIPVKGVASEQNKINPQTATEPA